LAGALDELWAQQADADADGNAGGGGGEPIFYSWVEFLREDGWCAAGLALEGGDDDGEEEGALAVVGESASRGSLQLGGVELSVGGGEAGRGRGDLRVAPMLQMAIRSASARAEAEAEAEDEEEEHRSTQSRGGVDGGVGLSRQQSSGAQAAASALERSVMELMRYNTFAAARAFDDATHTCEVCYDEKPGKKIASSVQF
jgi:hypothetical protein